MSSYLGRLAYQALQECPEADRARLRAALERQRAKNARRLAQMTSTPQALARRAQMEREFEESEPLPSDQGNPGQEGLAVAHQ